MSTQFTSTRLHSGFLAAILACGLALPVSSASAEANTAGGSGVGGAIAAQGNNALREIRNIPVILLTALAEAESRIAGLEAGADDYLAKPFDPRELVLRIQNILKRAVNPLKPKIDQLIFGPFTFSLVKRELRRGAGLIALTGREQEIMMIFAANAGQTIARHELAGTGADVGERTIDVQINRLRRKIEDDPGNPIWLQTVRGIGYKLCLDQSG